MSSTHGTQYDNGNYPTPPELARLICKMVRMDKTYRVLPDHKILEPGCGAGNFLQAIKETWPGVEPLGADIDHVLIEQAREAGHEAFYRDVLTFEFKEKYHLIIGNPPFALMEEFVAKLRPTLELGGWLVLVGSMNLWGSQARVKWFQKYLPARQYVLPARVFYQRSKTTGKWSSDSVPNCVFVWERGKTRVCQTMILDNRGIRNTNKPEAE